MEGLMRKLIKTAGLAVVFAAIAVSSADATTGKATLTSAAPIGTASNTAAISGNAAGFAAHTFTASGAQVTCADAVFRITSVTLTAATIDPIYSNCRFLVAGTPVGNATVHTPCDWTLTFSHASFTDTTGAGTGGTVTTNCSTTVTVPAVTCTIHVAAQTRAGISSQNIDAAGANSTSTTPWGSKIIASVAGLTYTTTTAPGGNCSIPEHGTGTYAGTVAVRNVWGML
jgi:hypothetical protein